MRENLDISLNKGAASVNMIKKYLLLDPEEVLKKTKGLSTKRAVWDKRLWDKNCSFRGAEFSENKKKVRLNEDDFKCFF